MPGIGDHLMRARERLHVAGERCGTSHGEAAGLSLPRDHAEQAGLADARLARDKQQLARVGCGIGKPTLDKGHEGIPAGQDR
jgi:hypothetical protein